MASEITNMATAELARRTLEDYEDARAELHNREPHLAGFHAAGMAAMEFDHRAYEAEHGIDLNRSVDEPPLSPVTEYLLDRYRESVKRIASAT